MISRVNFLPRHTTLIEALKQRTKPVGVFVVNGHRPSQFLVIPRYSAVHRASLFMRFRKTSALRFTTRLPNPAGCAVSFLAPVRAAIWPPRRDCRRSALPEPSSRENPQGE